MKTLNTIFAIIFLLLLYSCSDNNPVTTNNTDPNLLFSANELMCDYHDSVNNSNNYYWIDSLKYIVAPNRSFTKVKVTCDLEISSKDSIYKEFVIETKQNDSLLQNPLDSIYDNLHAVNNSYSFIFDLKYPITSEFKVELYLSLFINPNHSDYMKLKNIKIYKVD